MARITLSITAEEKKALLILAEKEFRHPRAQAALIVRNELIKLGLLEDPQPFLPAGSKEQHEISQETTEQ